MDAFDQAREVVAAADRRHQRTEAAVGLGCTAAGGLFLIGCARGWWWRSLADVPFFGPFLSQMHPVMALVCALWLSCNVAMILTAALAVVCDLARGLDPRHRWRRHGAAPTKS